MKKVILLAVTFLIILGIFTCTTAFAADWFAIRPNLSDEKFFGVWDGTQWTEEPKLNYSYHPSLQAAEEYVKQGDYSSASNVVFEYYKNDKEWYTAKLPDRKPGLANLVANMMFFNQTDSKGGYVTQAMVSGTDWQKVQFDVTDYVSGNRTLTGLWCTTLQKSDEAFLIGGMGGDMTPAIIVSIGGITMRIEASRVYTVSPEHTDMNPEILTLRECGMPYNENSSRPYFIFDLSSLSSETVNGAVMEIYVKSYTEEEIILPLGQAENPSATNPDWGNQITKSYNYNGVTAEEFNWTDPEGSIESYFATISRMEIWKTLIPEYVATGDELYAETALKVLLDMFYDQGKSLNIYQYTGGNALQGGGWPNSLGNANRLYAMIRLVQYTMKSEHMTADRFTELLKNFYICVEFLRDKDQIEVIDGVDTMYAAYGPANNWATYQAQGMMAVAQSFPEYTYAQHWLDLAIDRAEWVSRNRFILEDGAVSESGPLYSRGSFGTVAEFLQFIPEGTERRERFENMLVEWARYVGMQTLSPAGEDVRYGDAPGAGGPGSDSRGTLRNVLDHIREDELLYFYSHGEEGTPPKVDSHYYPLRRQAFLRTGWDRDDLYLFINNDFGYGGHGHPDDLHVTVAAYGNTLLIDAGTDTYSATDRDNYIRYTTDAHNTVTINNAPQKFSDTMVDNGTNETYFFTTQKEFDFWHGDTPSNEGFLHHRAVTFVRPSYWIVSDFIDPYDTTKVNNYKQNWHSSNDFSVYGNYNGKAQVSGTTIQVVQSDTDDMYTETLPAYSYVAGWRTIRYMRSVKNVAGRATFDTILYPARSTDSTKVSAKKIELGHDATGSVITFDDGRNVTHDYYYLSYMTGDRFPVITFDKYTFDGKVALCENDASGQTVAANFAYGSRLTENGVELVKADRTLENITVEWDSNLYHINISAAEDIVGATLRIYAPNGTEYVTVNGNTYSVTRDGDHVVVSL